MGKFIRQDIQRIIMSGAGLDPCKARELTSRIIDTLAAALGAEETVELRGLGSLEVRERGERRARKPRTGEAVIVPARRYVVFHPRSGLKAALRKPVKKPGPGPFPECPQGYRSVPLQGFLLKAASPLCPGRFRGFLGAFSWFPDSAKKCRYRLGLALTGNYAKCGKQIKAAFFKRL